MEQISQVAKKALDLPGESLVSSVAFCPTTTITKEINMPKPISLTSEADFSEAVEAAIQIRDRFSLGENICFPRPSFVHARDNARDLRILFYGQA